MALQSLTTGRKLTARDLFFGLYFFAVLDTQVVSIPWRTGTHTNPAALQLGKAVKAFPSAIVGRTVCTWGRIHRIVAIGVSFDDVPSAIVGREDLSRERHAAVPVACNFSHSHDLCDVFVGNIDFIVVVW